MDNLVPNIKSAFEKHLTVVGIGASAGGLHAFKKLVEVIPEKTGMAYILIQHLDPSHESILTELLQKVTRVPIMEITDNLKIAPDHIYILPSNKVVRVKKDLLKLGPRKKNHHVPLPIDAFFSSLAETFENRAIGVVLSGTGPDGTLGLSSMRDHGGITIAQQPDSALFDRMPQCAIEADVVDFILPPELIPGKLMSLKDGIQQHPEKESSPEENHEFVFDRILTLLRTEMGVDFAYYKHAALKRRIWRRVALTMTRSLGKYLDHLSENKQELNALYHDLLIPVTAFFRDPKIFEQVCEKLLPEILKNKSERIPVRLWVAGCSTGQEAYSLMICIHEFLEKKAADIKIQVFATDISERAISKARTGIYKKNELTGISEKRLEKFFIKTNQGFQINKIIRNNCVFAFHNYLKDPPFSNMDLISCRNSLIYMDAVLQKLAFTTFHYSLNDNGYLLLGKSETAEQSPELFKAFDKKSSLYAKKPVQNRFLRVIPERGELMQTNRNKKYGNVDTGDYQKSADEQLLRRFAPSGVIINGNMDIVQFRGSTGKWLESSSGKPSLNLLKMAREDLSFELRTAFLHVKTTKKSYSKMGIPMQFMGKEISVTIEIIPLNESSEPHFLVLFSDTEASHPSQENHPEKNISAEKDSKDKSKSRLQIRRLQMELNQIREDYQTITEEHEAANEELQSSNEELLSGSEELQSLNEELQTSRQETQTMNEELIVLNQELYDRNEELNSMRLFAESIVATIREPLIILDKDLRIRNANESFYQKFQTTEEETVGKDVFQLGNHQWNIPGLKALLRKILPERTTITDYEVIHDFPAIGKRIMLLSALRVLKDTQDDQYILLAFEDVTEKRKVTDQLKLFADELEVQITERTESLRKVNADLRYSNESLQQFAYVASHDLQEPLRKIKTFSGLLFSGYEKEIPGDAKTLLTKIVASTERMSTLIREVLEFSRILHADISYSAVDLNLIIRENLKDFDLLIAERNARITVGHLPVIQGIPLQLGQLFNNLISNALKFSNTDIAPVIKISSEVLTREQIALRPELDQKLAYYKISVADNGIGFDPEFSSQIFLIFHRLHARTTFPGTGIGLALCKKIAINHHGDIEVVSKENEGSTFHVFLPEFQNNPE